MSVHVEIPVDEVAGRSDGGGRWFDGWLSGDLQYAPEGGVMGVRVRLTCRTIMVAPTPAMMRAAREGNRPEAVAYWGDPVHLEALARCLRAADVVTTSWAELVDPLADLSGRPAVHLPDLHPGRRSLVEFNRNMRGAFQHLTR